MSRRRRRRNRVSYSNFKARATSTYRVTVPIERPNTSAGFDDPRTTRADGGRVRPTFYEDGWNLSFELK